VLRPEERYVADYRPDENKLFPWVVRDRLEEPFSYVGPCFNLNDAAVVAYALSHRAELMRWAPEFARTPGGPEMITTRRFRVASWRCPVHA